MSRLSHSQVPAMPRQKPEPPPDADDPAQSRRFIDMAREVEADERLESFERAFARVTRKDGKPKPKGTPQSPKKT